MDSSDVKHNQRERSSHKNESVDDEVQKLFRRNGGKISSNEFVKLRNKYDDPELADKILKVVSEKHQVISKKAKKFAQLIREKYSNQQYPFHILLEKARLFKTKYGLSEDEFAEFQRIYEQELVGLRSPEVVTPANNMMKMLGAVNVDFQGFSQKLSDTDYKALQEILALFTSSRPLHAQVLLQSMQYKDCDYEAITGVYRRELGHRPGDSIHPVVAAMFLPRIDVLENHFLNSNLASIVKSRYRGESLNTAPDYELFYSLVNDPNDVVCDSRSTIVDLLNRCQVQQQLWKSVLHLRNGQYYNAEFRDFVGSVDMCKLNRQDNPDLVYGRYDGTILKRLLSAFSFRPTIVATIPVYNVVNINPYQQNVRPVVTSVPMINLRLPPSINDSDPINLEDSHEQHQIFIENNNMVPRHTSIIYSRGVLFFFVDRRANVIRYNDMQPFNIAKLPLAVSGFERLNTREVNFKPEITIRDDIYQLRSVVVAEVNRIAPEKNIVVGSSAMIMIHRDPSKGKFEESFLKYDPLAVTTVPIAGADNPNAPVTTLDGYSGDYSFTDLARQRGIIFMYQLIKDKTEGELIY